MRLNKRMALNSLLFAGILASTLNGCTDVNNTTSEAFAQAERNDTATSKATPVENKETLVESDAAVASSTEDSLTGPQRNAVRSAISYLNMTGFSRGGLIEQLSSDAGEGYSVADATAAVDSLEIDWNDNAAQSAKQYLNMTGFSCKGLIEQLSSSYGSQYTVEQATYGARQAGAC